MEIQGKRDDKFGVDGRNSFRTKIGQFKLNNKNSVGPIQMEKARQPQRFCIKMEQAEEEVVFTRLFTFVLVLTKYFTIKTVNFIIIWFLGYQTVVKFRKRSVRFGPNCGNHLLQSYWIVVLLSLRQNKR